MIVIVNCLKFEYAYWSKSWSRHSPTRPLKQFVEKWAFYEMVKFCSRNIRIITYPSPPMRRFTKLLAFKFSSHQLPRNTKLSLTSRKTPTHSLIASLKYNFSDLPKHDVLSVKTNIILDARIKPHYERR